MVSIIILSYNTEKLLDSCLESVYHSINGLPFEVIIIDNNSADESVAMIKRKYPAAVLIENSENVGFAKGVNLGARRAKGEFLLLLNSDTVMEDKSVQEMITFIKEDDNRAIVGGTLKNNDGSTSKSYGAFYSLWEVMRMLFSETGKKIHMSRQIASKVDWVSGGYLLVKRNVFEKLQGFDEHFFMYMEDMEFCYRARKNNYQTWYFPKATILHIGQGSSNRTFAIVQIYKGILYFYRKHKSFPEYLAVKMLLLIKSIAAIVTGALTGNTYLLTTYKKALQVTV